MTSQVRVYDVNEVYITMCALASLIIVFRDVVELTVRVLAYQRRPKGGLCCSTPKMSY